MHLMRIVAGLLFGLIVVAPLLVAESLAEAARRERERKKVATAESTRTYTNADLDQSWPRSQPGTSPAGPQTQPAASANPPSAVLTHPDWDALEKEWRARFAAARSRVVEAERRGWYETIETVFYGGVPVQMRVRQFQETPELIHARQALEDLQDELRRAGMPPGFGRE